MYSDEYHIRSVKLSCLEWSVICSLKEGETHCGDAFLVSEDENKVLIAVVDGLGHGSMAAKASLKAIELLERYNNQSLITLVKKCHEGLRDTRGVVMNLALINYIEHTLAWIGVGNVNGVLLQTDDSGHRKRMVQRSGIVGYNLPFLQVSVGPIFFGDILVFTTDGVRNDYLEKIDVSQTSKEIVNISESSFKTSDDALILAAKYKANKNHEYRR